MTRGYSVTQQQSIELKQNGIYHINDRFVQKLTGFRKERLVWVNCALKLFRGDAALSEINALMENIDGARVFNFFERKGNR